MAMRNRRRAVTAPPTPGEVLRKLLLRDKRLTQDQLADAMNVSRLSINELVNGKRGVTAEMALRLSKATSTSPEFWLNLQREVDLDEARYRLKDELRAVRRVREPLSAEELFIDQT
jgi:antitoxin HigA-1